MSCTVIPSRSVVLEIPELVALICESAYPTDRARLLRVSKLLFHCAAPLVWKDICGVTRLLGLIDGVTTRSEKTDLVCSNVVSGLHARERRKLDFPTILINATGYRNQ
jgi:hypothetical protein